MANDNEQQKTLGFMKIEPSGERFITENPTMMNITGAYVDKNYRQKDIGTSLLWAIHQWLSDNGYELCGVGYESFNILTSDFWNKYFTPYAYSLVRRIDERIEKYYLRSGEVLTSWGMN